MPFRKILIICTGNICRSPMAEFHLRKCLNEIRRTEIEVHSAGLGALVGHPADEKAMSVMTSRGMDLSGHRGRQITDEMVREANLILVMESSQRRAIESKWPYSRGKVYRLGEWGGYDIDDPYRQDEAAFRSALELIEQGVTAWLARLDGI